MRVDRGHFLGSVCVSSVKNVGQEVLLPGRMMSWPTVSCSVSKWNGLTLSFTVGS